MVENLNDFRTDEKNFCFFFSEENDLSNSGIYLKPQEIKINMGERNTSRIGKLDIVGISGCLALMIGGERVKKLLALILITIGSLFIISFSIIDDDFLDIIALLIGILLVLVGLMTFFHNTLIELNEDLDEDSPEVDEQKTNNSALPWLIGSVSTLAFILVASVIFLWLRSVADEILIGGPPPTLTGWEQSYQELTGFDDVSGLDLSLIHI